MEGESAKATLRERVVKKVRQEGKFTHNFGMILGGCEKTAVTANSAYEPGAISG